MIYSVQNLTEVADCEMLITISQKEKADLEYQKLSAERLTTRYTENSVEIEATLQGVIAELEAVETILTIVPEGPTKDDLLNRKTKLEYKKFLLENRKASYGVVALLEKQMELQRINSEITEVDVFINAVTDRKTELEAA
jgi:hypothetical protein